MSPRNTCHSGWSLLELVMVLGLMGLCASLVWPSYQALMQRSQRAQARVLLMQIWGMTQHYADYAVQARVMLECADDQPLDREHIARELTTSVLLSCGLAPI